MHDVQVTVKTQLMMEMNKVLCCWWPALLLFDWLVSPMFHLLLSALITIWSRSLPSSRRFLGARISKNDERNSNSQAERWKQSLQWTMVWLSCHILRPWHCSCRKWFLRILIFVERFPHCWASRCQTPWPAWKKDMHIICVCLTFKELTISFATEVCTIVHQEIGEILI